VQRKGKINNSGENLSERCMELYRQIERAAIRSSRKPLHHQPPIEKTALLKAAHPALNVNHLPKPQTASYSPLVILH
jgi:hypothetical protein